MKHAVYVSTIAVTQGTRLKLQRPPEEAMKTPVGISIVLRCLHVSITQVRLELVTS